MKPLNDRQWNFQFRFGLQMEAFAKAIGKLTAVLTIDRHPRNCSSFG
jgi:hypothetical protein